MSEHVDLSHEQVYQAQQMSHGLWSGGETLEQRMHRLRELQHHYPGAFRYVGIVDGARTIASMKLYSCFVQVDGEQVHCVGLGAIFTRDDMRRKGYAAKLIRSVTQEAMASGIEGIYLWSDIGTRFYENFGFTPYEQTKDRYVCKRVGIRDTTNFRLARKEDRLFQLQSYHDVAQKAPLSTMRTKDLWGFYRIINDANDHIVLASNGDRIGYFSASVEKNALWIDEAIALPGFESNLWQSICTFAASRDVNEAFSWRQPFGVLPSPINSEAVRKPIPMLKLFGRKPPETRGFYFGALDHF